jgi:sporulation protein YlmC with PRC-barrel domain
MPVNDLSISDLFGKTVYHEINKIVGVVSKIYINSFIYDSFEVDWENGKKGFYLKKSSNYIIIK